MDQNAWTMLFVGIAISCGLFALGVVLYPRLKSEKQGYPFEAEIEAAVNEITEDTPAEDKATVDESVAAFEADQAALETEQGENESSKKNLEGEIEKLHRGVISSVRICEGRCICG